LNLSTLSEQRNAKWIALLLAVITIITRIPFASNYLYHWDSVNMAFGIQHFDVLNGAPQFPGYIVYILLAQFVNGLLHNEQTTMVLISVISSGLAAAVLFYLGRDMFNPIVGIIAALFLMTSPLFWFYGEIALPHALDLLVVTLSAWMLYRVMNGQTRWLWWTTVLLGLVCGFRQQDLLFLAPLALFAGYRIGIIKIIQVLILGALVCLAWFIPLMVYSNGIQTYLRGSSDFTASFMNSTSLLSGAGTFGLKRNIVEKLIPYTLYAWSLAALLALYWLARLPGSWRNWLTNRKVWFLILWITPVLAFYAFIHMGQQGLVFVFMPALWLVSAAGLYVLLAARPAALLVSTAVLVLVSAGIFVLLPTYPLGENAPKLLTYATLRESDQSWSNKIALVEANFAPENTLLLAANWRHVEFYLSDYHYAAFTVGSKYELTEGEPVGADYTNQPVSAAQLGLTPGQDWNVVLMDDELQAFASDPSSLQQMTMPDGFTLSYFTIKPDEAYWTDGEVFGVKPLTTPSG
jgi:Dolichyl-phosphate-mannose-protein mannosyltransferase